jgi:hypothetical protein
MKTINSRPIKNVISCLFLTISLGVAGSGVAAPKTPKNKPVQPSTQAPQSNPEAFRQELNNYLTDWEDALRPFTENPAIQQKFVEGGLQPLEQLAKAKQSLTELSPEQMTEIEATYAKFPGWRQTPGTAKAMSQKFGAADADPQDIGVQFITPDTCSTNPDAEVPSNTDIAATTAAYIALDALMEAFPTDAITVLARLPAIAARAAGQAAVLAVETLKAINDDCTSLGASDVQDIVSTAQSDIITNANSNITTLLGNLTTVQNAIINNDNSNTSSIVNNDNTNRTTIVNNDNTNTSTITTAIGGATTTITTAIGGATTNINNNSNANTSAITTAVSSAQTAIVNNSNANATTIVNNSNANTTTIVNNANANKNELLRTQIEQDLAQADNATAVAAFMTTSARGGYIQLVQAIVIDTLNDVQALGGSIVNAQSFLTQANAALTAGQYRTAYSLFRKAYKSAGNSLL